MSFLSWYTPGLRSPLWPPRRARSSKKNECDTTPLPARMSPISPTLAPWARSPSRRPCRCRRKAGTARSETTPPPPRSPGRATRRCAWPSRLRPPWGRVRRRAHGLGRPDWPLGHVHAVAVAVVASGAARLALTASALTLLVRAGARYRWRAVFCPTGSTTGRQVASRRCAAARESAVRSAAGALRLPQW